MDQLGESVSHYAILERLGEGGMGVVYKAQDTKLKRTVALKFLRSGVFGSDAERARFVREAQVAAGLDHPHICPVYEIDEHDGQAFIAMAFCPGRTLRERIREGPLPVREALDIAAQIAEGLDEAHGKGVIHRDIKSGNIMLSDKGLVRIMDFGIARLSQGPETTWSGTVSGTAAYMAPEQAMGGPVDARTDLWALGVVIYEMLTGELPFKGGTDAGIVHAVLYERPKALRSVRPDCPSAVVDVVDRCLRKRVEERYDSAKAVLADIEGVRRHSGPVAGLTTGETLRTARHRTPAARRRQRIMAVVGAVALAIAADFAVPGLRRGLAALVGYRPVPAEKHLLVLPFLNVGGEKAGQDLCDGFLEVLTSELTRLERFQKAFWVAPANEVRKSGVASAREARREFGANLVIAGSLQRVGGEVTLTMNLIEAGTLRQIRSEVATGSMSGLASFQGPLLEGAVRMLDMEIAPGQRRGLAASGTANAEAYECYVKGRGRLERYEKPEGLAEAVDLFHRAVRLDPAYAPAYLGLAEALWRRSEATSNPALVDPALDACSRAAELGAEPAALHAVLGLIQRGRGLVEDAVREFETALGSDPSNQEATLGLAETWEALGKPERAEDIYRKAIALKPSRWAGYSHLGVFYLNQNRFSEAEGMFLKVLELTPDNVRALNNLMAVYWYMKRDERVRWAFERSIGVRPNADAYSNMGTIDFYSGRNAEAAKMFELAVRADAGSSTIWGNLGDSYRYVAGNEDKARDAYERAIVLAGKEKEINPQDATLRARLALYLAHAGRGEESLAELDEALRLAPASPTVLRKSVLTYERLGLRSKALEAAGRLFAGGGAPADLEADPDLARLTRAPAFRELVRAIPETAGRK
jgi:tetratricopeptide (TPR) repeat protein/TolB-like protein/predicted Ser/Thr protein kinase